MSKAILVIDMPDSCDVCKFCYYTMGETPVCSLENLVAEPQDRPNWCPLKRLPEKQTYYLGISDENAGWVDGWNDCLDCILRV